MSLRAPLSPSRVCGGGPTSRGLAVGAAGPRLWPLPSWGALEPGAGTRTRGAGGRTRGLPRPEETLAWGFGGHAVKGSWACDCA